MARNIKIKEKSHAVSNGITVLVLIFAIAVCVIAAGNLYQIYGQYKAGSDEYDWSMKGRLDRLTQTLGGRR